MKWLCTFLIFTNLNSFGQAGVEIPNKEYAQMILHPATETHNLSYNYSGKWDIDGDDKMDSLYFIGNGGVHTYFFLRIILSAKPVIKDFPFIEIDRPYFFENKKVLENDNGEQLVIDDFDKDGKTDIYLNINRPYFVTPKELKHLKIDGPKILIQFKQGKLALKDYNNKVDFRN